MSAARDGGGAGAGRASSANIAATAADVAKLDWQDSPGPHLGGQGPVRVHVAVEMLKLSEINAVRSTAAVQLDVNLFWKDSRIAALHRERAAEGGLSDNDLPPGLWRPSFDLQQRCADIPHNVFSDPNAPTREWPAYPPPPAPR